MTPARAEPDRPARPTAVTVAFWLQAVAVVVLLTVAVLTVVGAVQFDGQIDRAVAKVPDADPDEVSGERFGNVFMSVLVCLPVLVLAGWLAATARPVLRGGRTARVLVFVAAGTQLLCCAAPVGLGVAFLPFLLTAEWEEPLGEDGAPVWEESRFSEVLYGTSSDVLTLVSGLGTVLALLLTLAVVLLLALPPGSRYFRSEEERLRTAAGPWQWPPAPAVLPPSAAAVGDPVAPVVPFGPSGHPAPVVYAVPPGYLICPDPSRHLPAPPETGKAPEAGEVGKTLESPQAGEPPRTGGS